LKSSDDNPGLHNFTEQLEDIDDQYYKHTLVNETNTLRYSNKNEIIFCMHKKNSKLFIAFSFSSFYKLLPIIH